MIVPLPGFVTGLFFSFLVAASVFPRVAVAKTCGTVISPESVANAESRFRKLKASRRFAASNTENVVIPLVFRVISQNDTLEGGNIPDEQISAQMDVLNADFAPSGVNFTLVNTTRTTNAAWFNNLGPDEPEETEAKSALRVGGPETLNVYTVGFASGSAVELLGYATFPYQYARAPEMDGVVILYSTVPGGTTAPCNLGRTLTHEVGLYHTFRGGCDGGDFVSDTAPKASPALGCPIGRDTCTGDDLPDPVINFMDYTDHSCMTEFTTRQAARFLEQILVYRNL